MIDYIFTRTAVSLALCLPLFFICVFDGTNLFSKQGILNLLLSFIALLPALAILAATTFEKTQFILLLLLFCIIGLEGSTGITTTNQLNHEGTDTVFLLFHLLHFMLSVIVIIILFTMRFFKKDSTEIEIQ